MLELVLALLAERNVKQMVTVISSDDGQLALGVDAGVGRGHGQRAAPAIGAILDDDADLVAGVDVVEVGLAVDVGDCERGQVFDVV